MDVNLWDLGRKRQATLLQWRAASLNSQSARGGVMGVATLANETQRGRIGPMARLWVRGADIPMETVMDALGAMHGQAQGTTYGLVGGSMGFWIPALIILTTGNHVAGDYIGGGLMVSLGVLMSGIGLSVPGMWLKRLCRPSVSAAEVNAMLVATTDDLERAYLRLVADVVRQDMAPEAAGRVRDALQAFGKAIDQLPAVSVPRAGEDILREEAARAHDEARREADLVVAASHERRADALGRTADAALRSLVLTRRASALRSEMVAQIESLRMGLAGFETASGDVAGLTSLADAVRSVATESLSVTDARLELDTVLSGGPTAETTLRLGGPTRGR